MDTFAFPYYVSEFISVGIIFIFINDTWIFEILFIEFVFLFYGS